MRIFFSLFLLFSLCLSIIGDPIPFSPIVKNYSILDYHAGIQNWSIAQDKDGVMYFANNKGVLKFDGARWQLFELPTKGVVRSIYIGTDDRIYVGAYEEFGYFSPTSGGGMEYHSLKDKLKGFQIHNDEVWNISFYQGDIVFQSFASIFYYNGESVSGVRKNLSPLNMFLVDSVCYAQQINGDLCVLSNRVLSKAISRECFHGSDVIAGFSIASDSTLFFTRDEGLYISSAGKTERMKTPCDDMWRRYTINRVTRTKDNIYIIGTITNGIYAIDGKGKLLWTLNTNTNLRNNTILGLFCDDDNNIWVAMDDGLAYIQSNSMIYYYEPTIHKIGMIYDVLVREDDAYIASNQGVYYLHDGQLQLVPSLSEQAWYIEEHDNKIICGHNKGTFLLNGTESRKISDVRGSMCLQKIVDAPKNYLLEGTYTFLNMYSQDSAASWRKQSIKGFSHMIRHIEIDHRGNVWAKHLRKGLYQLRVNLETFTIESVKEYKHIGSSQCNDYALFKINGRIVFSDGDLFYTYDDMSDSIVEYELMNRQLPDVKKIRSASERIGSNHYWFVGEQAAYLINCQQNSFKVESIVPYTLFNGLTNEDRGSMHFDRRRNCSYLCLNNAIACIRRDTASIYHSSPHRRLWISSVHASDDLTGEEQTFDPTDKIKIKTNCNTVSFGLSYPAYNDSEFRVRYQLKGYSNQWVVDGQNLYRKYSKLPIGHYILRVEVFDAQGVLSEAQLQFIILRPWYLSYGAILGYVILVIGLIAFTQWLVIRRVKKNRDRMMERQRMEHQRELERQENKIMELEKEQLSADLRFKSKELSSAIMTNIAQKEFLNTLKEEIISQKTAGQCSKKNLDKLLVLINNNMVSDEENWAVFQANFDRIHENFFRNLKLQYPDLTPGDLRFCALLRLNMPSKEIAKLQNISLRGVDAARYRLRKRLGLQSEDSITDFLINFK